MSHKDETQILSRRDYLAIERTMLANERTFLAYFRTAAVFLGAGLGILKLEILEEIKGLGLFFVFLSPILLTIGIIKYRRTKKRIKQENYQDAI